MTLSEKKDLYRRFLANELNAAELELFLSLIEQGELDSDYQQVMPDLEDTGKTIQIQTIGDNDIDSAKSGRLKVIRLLSKISIAASILLVAGLWYNGYRRSQREKAEQTMLTVHVPTGSMQIITLKDRSVVTLNSGSVFRYPQAFTAKNRKVYLIKGKGFFEVAKDKRRPFTVYTAKLSTTALGTSFTIENYHTYQLEKVRLYTGKVEIGSTDRSFPALRLSPGQQYIHTGSSGTRSAFNTEHATAIQEDATLRFEETTLTDALIRVASYYSIHIRFDQNLMRRYSISGTFHNEPVEDVLRTLLFTHQLNLKKIPQGYEIMK